MNQDSRPTVLVAEDSPDDRELLRYVFEKFLPDVELMFAADGAELIAMLLPSEPDAAPTVAADLLLLDIKLPKLSGLDALEKLRADRRTRDVPMIMFSSSSEPKDIERAHRAGCTAYVFKPTPFEEYQDVVVRACRFGLRQVGAKTGGES